MSPIGTSSIGDPSSLLGWKGLVIRMVGVGREGVVAVDEIDDEGEGLSGSFSSRFFGRRDDRNIFLKPVRVRKLLGDLGGVLGIANSATVGETDGRGDRGVLGAGIASDGNL